MVEVLIVGAGPAGAVAALLLARAGVRVLVVDRARFPRDKLCGDTLNPGALQILRRLGVAEGIEARGLPIAGMLVTGLRGNPKRDGRGATAPSSVPSSVPASVSVRGLYGRGHVGRALVRRDLDQGLIEAAVRAGAQFQDGVRVGAPIVEEADGRACVRGVTLVTREGRTLRMPALMTIAADGRRSGLAFTLGLARQPAWPRRWAIGGYMTDVDGLDQQVLLGEMHIRRGHYLGVAPLPSGLTNVCYVSSPSRGLSDPAKVLVSQLGADPLLRDRMARARLVGAVTMMGPLAVDVPAAGMPGLLLAGDAAGFVDPMTGDGLRFALRGAELAAAVAARCLEAPEHEGHRTLTALRTREFAGKYRFNRSLRALVASDTGVRAGTFGARLAPAVLRRIIRYAGDEKASSTSVA